MWPRSGRKALLSSSPSLADSHSLPKSIWSENDTLPSQHIHDTYLAIDIAVVSQVSKYLFLHRSLDNPIYHTLSLTISSLLEALNTGSEQIDKVMSRSEI